MSDVFLFFLSIHLGMIGTMIGTKCIIYPTKIYPRIKCIIYPTTVGLVREE